MLKKKFGKTYGRHSLNAFQRQSPAVEVVASDLDAQQFVRLVAERSEMFQGVLQKNGIEDKQGFASFLMRSQCYLTKIKNQMEALLIERRLGSNLKGMNKDIQKEIEQATLQNLNREAQLYSFDLQFHSDKREFASSIAQRKEHILLEMEQLRNNQIL